MFCQAGDGIRCLVRSRGLGDVYKRHRQFGPPKHPLEVLSFCEEEGSRFNGARFWGSRGVTGAIAPGDAEAIGSYDGVSLAEAMQSVGLDPADIPSAVRHDIEAFIELHIEQGPVLEIEDLPVGVVNIINGSKGYNVTVTGEANHAGTTRLEDRRDAGDLCLSGHRGQELSVPDLADAVREIRRRRDHPLLQREAHPASEPIAADQRDESGRRGLGNDRHPLPRRA